MEDIKLGKVAWLDLTVDNAQEVSEFYKDVIGWEIQGFDMGGYEDYCMNDPKTGDTMAGVCHARGGNTSLPAQWLVYLTVEDFDKSLVAVEAKGGKVLGEKKSDGRGGYYCLVQDPAGAYFMLSGKGKGE